MANVNFTYALRRFFPEIKPEPVDAGDVAALLEKLETKYPGFQSYIVDDQGRLRKHVNIFVDGILIHDRIKLSDTLTKGSDVYIMQALSGG